MASADCARLHLRRGSPVWGKAILTFILAFLGAIFRPAASSLGCENLGKSGGIITRWLGFPSYAARPLGNAPDNPRRVSGGCAPCGVRRVARRG